MKKILSIFPIIFALCIFNAHADSKAREAYLKNLTQFFPTFSQNIGQIWPGMSVAANPVIIAFESDTSDTSLYAINFNTQNPAWQKRLINNMPIYYMAQDNIGARQFRPTLSSFYFNLENNQALIYYPMFSEKNYPENESIDFSLDNGSLVQYFFTLHEISHSPHANDMLTNWDRSYILHKDFNIADHLALLLIESAALDDYLHSHNEEALKNFAAIAQYRVQSSDMNTKKFESAYPMLPCLLYVEFQTIYSNEQKKLEAIESLIPASAIHPISNTTLIDPQEEYRSALSFNQTAASFALDNILPQTWKTTVQTTDATPTDILQSQYRINNAKDLMERLNIAKNRYHFVDLYLALNNIIGDKLRKIAAIENSYKKDTNPEIIIEITYGDNENNGYYTNYLANYAIDSQNEIYEKVDRLEHNIGSQKFLKANNIEIVFFKREMTTSGLPLISYKFKLNPNTSIEIDNHIETLAHFMRNNQARVVDSAIHLFTPGKNNAPNIITSNKTSIKVENGTLKITI